MQQLLTQMNLYTLTDRCPQAYDLQNYTYIATKGEKGVQVCKSVVDYIVAPEHMYKASAIGGVQQDQWEISGSAHRVLWARLPVANEVAPPKPRQKPYMKWRVERLTDKKTGPKVTEAYQKMIAKVLARVKAQLETLAKPTDLDKLCDATVQAIVQAAHTTVGRKRIVPGRTKTWWCAAIDDAIDVRRQLHKAWIKQPTPRTYREYRAALKTAKDTRTRCKLEYIQQQATELNEIYHQKINERSTNGEKRFWNAAKRLPGMGNNAATPPAMLRDPISGMLQCTKQGVLAAQVHHTQQLGSQQRFAVDNPNFDSEFLAHVTAEVAACAYCATAAEQSETGADEAMNGPITEDEVLEALLGLNNGKAAR
jgi:hypothetical protein